MQWLNYHHLLYFWMVAREGGLGPAGKILRLSHPTLSGQIKQLEESLGERLFDRTGRSLVLTERGRLVYRYADEIFGLGRELLDALQGSGPGALRTVVGVTDVVPKHIVARLVDPALRLPEPVKLVVVEDRYERLLAALALHEIDVVIADGPVPPGSPLRAYTHALAESTVTLVAAPERAAALREGFPGSMDGQAFILPAEGATLRRSLEHWFESVGVRPTVSIEVQDQALAKVFARSGRGVTAVPTTTLDGALAYGLEPIAEVPEVTERFFAITSRRKLVNRAVAAICRGR